MSFNYCRLEKSSSYSMSTFNRLFRRKIHISNEFHNFAQRWVIKHFTNTLTSYRVNATIVIRCFSVFHRSDDTVCSWIERTCFNMSRHEKTPTDSVLLFISAPIDVGFVREKLRNLLLKKISLWKVFFWCKKFTILHKKLWLKIMLKMDSLSVKFGDLFQLKEDYKILQVKSDNVPLTPASTWNLCNFSQKTKAIKVVLQFLIATWRQRW